MLSSTKLKRMDCLTIDWISYFHCLLIISTQLLNCVLKYFTNKENCADTLFSASYPVIKYHSIDAIQM